MGGKRTREKTDEEIRNKIQRLEKELHFRRKPPEQNEDSEFDQRYEPEVMDRDDHCGGNDDIGEEKDMSERRWPESVVALPLSVPGSPRPKSPSQENDLPLEILEVLGEAKKTEETLGKKIPAEIAERWEKILVEGLSKEQKEALLTKLLIPENFQLSNAPKLNAEVASVLTDATKNRDKRLEKMQNQLGSGIAGIAKLTSELISNDLDKMDIIKQLSETNQILLDLHYEETMNRRRLIIPILDKRFINIIQGVKREKFLFGDNLSENIKNTKSIEKSSLQIKKSIPPAQASTSRRFTVTSAQGNSRLAPRQSSGQGAARGPPAQARCYPVPPPPAARRPPPAPRRPPPPPPARPQDRRYRR